MSHVSLFLSLCAEAVESLERETFIIVHKENMADQTPQSPTLKDLPKVQSDLKSQLEHFDPQVLKNIDPQEKTVLPTAEGNFF